MKKIIHIPHTSLYIPESHKQQSLISQNELDEENLFMCDYRVDELVPEEFAGQILKFDYSRLYCDVEKFRGAAETMNKYGMGYMYTNSSKGSRIFNITGEHRRKVDTIYEGHHRKLDCMATEVLETYGECRIIDLHSYSDECIKRIFGMASGPDVCIGVEKGFYDENDLQRL